MSSRRQRQGGGPHQAALKLSHGHIKSIDHLASTDLQSISANLHSSSFAGYIPTPSLGAKRLDRTATCAVPVASMHLPSVMTDKQQPQSPTSVPTHESTVGGMQFLPSPDAVPDPCPTFSRKKLNFDQNRQPGAAKEPDEGSNITNVNIRGTHNAPSPVECQLQELIRVMYPSSSASDAATTSVDNRTKKPTTVCPRFVSQTLEKINRAATSSVENMFLILDSVLRSMPLKTSDIKEGLDYVIDNRQKLVENCESLQHWFLRMGIVTMMQQEKIASQDAEITWLNKNYKNATDYTFAADERIQELHQIVRDVKAENEKLQLTFDQRVQEMLAETKFVLQKAGIEQNLGTEEALALRQWIPKHLLEKYHSSDLQRLETENKEMRAHQLKLEKMRIEKKAMEERSQRLVGEHRTAMTQLKELESKNESLVMELKNMLAKLQASQERFNAEKEILSKDLKRTKLLGSPKQKETIMKNLQWVVITSTRSRFFHAWKEWTVGHKKLERYFADDEVKKIEIAMEKKSLEDALRTAKHEKVLKAAELEDKVDRQFQEIHALTKIVEQFRGNNSTTNNPLMSPQASQIPSPVRHHDENVSLAVGSTSLTDAEQHSEAVVHTIAISSQVPTASPREPSPNTTLPLLSHGWNITELQQGALEVYNILHPVLQGVKRRLKLTVACPTLRLYEATTDNIVITVFNWVKDYYKFLFLILTLDDRMLKTKSRLTFLSISIRPKLTTLYRKEKFTRANVPERSIVQRKLEGYETLMRKIDAIRARIDATRLSLQSCSDITRQQEIGTLATAFEVELEDFFRQMKLADSIQFQLSLRLMKMDNINRHNIREKIDRKFEGYQKLSRGRKGNYKGKLYSMVPLQQQEREEKKNARRKRRGEKNQQTADEEDDGKEKKMEAEDPDAERRDDQQPEPEEGAAIASSLEGRGIEKMQKQKK